MAHPDRDRAIAFIRAHDRALADRIEPFRWGEALLTPSLPRVHDVNFLLVESVPRQVDASELGRDAERLMAPVAPSHRRVNVDDEVTAARLRPDFAAKGWQHEQFLVMARRGEPDRAPPPDLAEEVDPASLRGAREEAIRAWGAWADDDLVDQLIARGERLRSVTDVRAFAVQVDGRPVSHAYLYRDGPRGPVAQVEEVETLEPFRGRGYARAVVVAAARAASDAALVFLVTSAFDWPQHLYRKLGFEAIGTEDRFLALLD